MRISVSGIMVARYLEGLIILKTTKNAGLNIKCYVKDIYDITK